MDQVVLIDKSVPEFNNVKGMAQRNVAEKVMHEKLKRQIDIQKKAFVKQHSKDEKEVKVTLQRLQLEQHLFDASVEDLSDEENEEEKSPDTSEDEGVVNPYPVMILPKFGTTPQKDINKNQGLKGHRRKSLEFEDVDKLQKGSTGMRTALIATSFISKLRSPFQKRITHNEKAIEQDENWCEQWETTASIRRPRKTIAEQNQHKLLQRANTEIVRRPGSSLSSSVTSLLFSKRNCSSKYNSKKDDTITLNDLHFEGTVNDSSLSPRSPENTKSRRGGSLKEKKKVVDENGARMKRSNSTKERGKHNPSVSHEDIRKTKSEQTKPLSRKNSSETKDSKASNIHKTIPRKGSHESDITEKHETVNKHAISENCVSKFKHTRQSSLKERGEVKYPQSWKMKRFAGSRKDTAGDKKNIRKQKALSTDSSPVDSPKTSPLTKEGYFKF